MKATVMEIRGRHAVLLAKDGTFIKMKCGKLKIGDSVSVKETKMSKPGKLGAVAAAAAVALLMGGGVYSYATPAYYVSLDVNPGMIMEVNMYDLVIGTEAVNEDAEAVIDGLKLNNTDITDALSLTVERIDELGYFEEGGEILIGTTSENEKTAEDAAEEIGSVIEDEVAGKDINAEVITKIIGFDMVQAAKAIEGMTPGKYNIIVNHLGISPDHAQDYVKTSIKEIMKEVIALKAASREKADDAENEGENPVDLGASTGMDIEEDSESVTEVEEENTVKPSKENKAKEKTTSENKGKSEDKDRTPLEKPEPKKKAPDESQKKDNEKQVELQEKEEHNRQTEVQKEKEKSESNQKPVTPEQPDKPVKSDESGKTAKPEEPGKSEKPGEEGKTARPEEPGKSEKSDESGKPVEPGKSEKPETPSGKRP